MTTVNVSPISAYVLTHNSAAHLPDLLQRLCAIADEVLVFDSGSTDATESIARNAGARFLYHPFRDFRSQREAAEAACAHRYIFFCDSDELPDDHLVSAIHMRKQQGLHHAAYTVWRYWHAYARPVRVVYPVRSPDCIPRLYDRTRCHWEPRRQIHETLRVDGPTEALEGRLQHYTFSSDEEIARKLERYTDLAAETLAARARQRRRTGPVARATYRVKGWLFSPIGAIFKSYLVRGGWRDGSVGWHLLKYAVRYSSRKYRKAADRLAS